MYAVIVTGGKQYRVCEGDTIYVEKLNANEGEAVEFDNVLVIGGDKDTKFGTPTVAGATVSGKIVKHGKAKKITVFTYRSKKDSKRKIGHRQQFTKVEITAIKG
ncbi:MAG: 50S ribosomal protein L21 [Oscillospiraceae bacterium]